MNALQGLEKINSLNFKLLIFMPLISFFCIIILAKLGFSSKLIYSFYIILFVLQAILFCTG